jgi:hypothetical protein
MDALLRLAFRLSGSRAVSDLISERRVNRRWAEARARHIAAGGVCMTLASDAGEQSFLL